jgi:hypothetical protein
MCVCMRESICTCVCVSYEVDSLETVYGERSVLRRQHYNRTGVKIAPRENNI